LTWLEDLLAARRRKGLSERTIRTYHYTLTEIVNHQHLDLETCNREDLLKVLDENRKSRSPGYYALQTVLIKSALKFLKRSDLAKEIERPKIPDAAGSIKTIERTDIERLIHEAPSLQDRLLVELFYETGARSGEIRRLRIRDIQFDEFGGIISLTGKTGTRRRRVYASVPDLREQINNHRDNKNPDAVLFLNVIGNPFGECQMFRHIRSLGRRILGKEIHPHMFRHTRATEDSRIFTDSEMMLLFAWNRPDMVRVYSHLSMRDVEDKDLALHGLKKREEAFQAPISVQRCGKCQEQNAPLAIYCQKCGSVLAQGSQVSMEELLKDMKFIEGLTQNQQFIGALRKALKIA
jgi:integrase/recombinase XerD